jgi:hypothetical protein
MPIQLKFRRGTAALWTSTNPMLASGEIAIETDTNLFKIGDGQTAWNTLGYAGIDGPTGTGFTIASSGAGRVLTSDGTATGAIAQANLLYNSTNGTLTTNTISSLTGAFSTIQTVNISTLTSQTNSMNAKLITYPGGITVQTSSLSVLGELVVPGSILNTGLYNTVTYDYSQFGQIWLPATTAEVASVAWKGIAVSGSGQYQIAVASTGIYVSADYGATWTAQLASLAYVSPGISKSGQYMTVPVIGGNLYVSSDFGQTWLPEAPALNWYNVSISATGQYQTAVANGIYISADYGQTWAISSATTTQQWTCVAVSATGQYQMAASSGYIYISSDYGQIWTSKNTVNQYTSIAVSATGQYATATAQVTGLIWISSDYGQTWASKGSSGNWGSVTMSDSGKYQAATLISGNIYMSSDFGNTWVSKGASTTWRSVGISGSGQYMTANVSTGGVYTSVIPTYFPAGITVSAVSIGQTYSTSTYALQLATDSAAKPTTTTWTISSDARIKTDIESADIDICYSTIRALNLKYFEWDSNIYSDAKDRHVLGFIAQEVKAVFPKSVNIHDTFCIGQSTLTNFHTLNVSQIQNTNIGAVKRLMEIVGNQEVTLSSLTGQYDAQQSTLTSQYELRQSTIDGYLSSLN